MDFEVMKAYLPRFWDALLLTLRIGWQGVALALALGVACAVAVHWKIPVLRQIVGGYIELFRNTPLLVQLFFLYFALPKIGVRISAETCGKLGLGHLRLQALGLQFGIGHRAAPPFVVPRLYTKRCMKSRTKKRPTKSEPLCQSLQFLSLSASSASTATSRSARPVTSTVVSRSSPSR